jgi:Family of unknown function (DUF6263)
MKSIKYVLLAATFATGLFLGCKTGSSVAGGPALQFNFQQGKTYTYTMDIDMNQAVAGQNINTNMISGFDMAVAETDTAGNKILNTTYKSMKMTMDRAGEKMVVDTDEKLGEVDEAAMAANPMLMMKKMFASIKGKTIKMTVNKKGEITKVTGFSEMLKSMVESITQNEQMRSLIMQNAEQQFNEESAKQSFAYTFNFYPDKDVKVGESWTRDITTDGAMAMLLKNTYTLKAIEGDRMTIEVVSKILPKPGNTDGVTGDMNGVLVVDKKSGLVVQGDITQKMKGNLSSGGQNVPMDITTKAKITGKEQ